MGIIGGLLLKKAVPQAISQQGLLVDFSNFLTSPENLGLLILGFFFTELLIAMIFRKPYKSTQISFGILVMPLVWTAIVEIPPLTPPDLAIRVLAYSAVAAFSFGTMFLLWIIVVFASSIIPFLVGIDTDQLENGRLLSSSFGYEITLSKVDNGLIDTIAERCGFSKVSSCKSNASTLLSHYSKGEVEMGVICRKKEENSVDTVFSFFSVQDDTTKECEDKQEVLDYNAQIFALLNIRKNDNEGIEKIAIFSPQSSDLQFLGKGIERKEAPKVNEIKTSIKQFPKSHPIWFSVIMTLITVLIAEVIRRLLGAIS